MLVCIVPLASSFTLRKFRFYNTILKLWWFIGSNIIITSSALKYFYILFSHLIWNHMENFLTSKAYARKIFNMCKKHFWHHSSIMFYIQHYLKSCRIIISVGISLLVYFMQLLYRDHLRTIKVILSQAHQFTGFYN